MACHCVSHHGGPGWGHQPPPKTRASEANAVSLFAAKTPRPSRPCPRGGDTLAFPPQADFPTMTSRMGTQVGWLLGLSLLSTHRRSPSCCWGPRRAGNSVHGGARPVSTQTWGQQPRGPGRTRGDVGVREPTRPQGRFELGPGPVRGRQEGPRAAQGRPDGQWLRGQWLRGHSCGASFRARGHRSWTGLCLPQKCPRRPGAQGFTSRLRLLQQDTVTREVAAVAGAPGTTGRRRVRAPGSRALGFAVHPWVRTLRGSPVSGWAGPGAVPPWT